MALKKIVYQNVTYLYEVSNSFFDGGTYVYDATPIEYIERKYVFFGPRVVKTKYEFLFHTHMDFELPCYTKSEIESKFRYELNLINRKKEIESGNIL